MAKSTKGSCKMWREDEDAAVDLVPEQVRQSAL